MKSIDEVAPDVTILLAQTPPIDPSAPGYKYRVDADEHREELNARLPGLIADARALGIDARYVPMPGLTTGDLFDGIHPSPGGYAKIAGYWYGALKDGLAVGEFGGPRHSTAGIRDIDGSDLGDFLRGDGAANKIFGRKGADRIEGGAGADVLTGGAAADVFVFRRPADGADRITDFARRGLPRDRLGRLRRRPRAGRRRDPAQRRRAKRPGRGRAVPLRRRRRPAVLGRRRRRRRRRRC